MWYVQAHNVNPWWNSRNNKLHERVDVELKRPLENMTSFIVAVALLEQAGRDHVPSLDNERWPLLRLQWANKTLAKVEVSNVQCTEALRCDISEGSRKRSKSIADAMHDRDALEKALEHAAAKEPPKKRRHAAAAANEPPQKQEDPGDDASADSCGSVDSDFSSSESETEDPIGPVRDDPRPPSAPGDGGGVGGDGSPPRGGGGGGGGGGAGAPEPRPSRPSYFNAELGVIRVEVQGATRKPKCKMCNQQINPQNLRLVYSWHTKRPWGYICYECASPPFSAMLPPLSLFQFTDAHCKYNSASLVLLTIAVCSLPIVDRCSALC